MLKRHPEQTKNGTEVKKMGILKPASARDCRSMPWPSTQTYLNQLTNASFRSMAKKKAATKRPSNNQDSSQTNSTSTEKIPSKKTATKKNATTPVKGFEESLWDSANRLRGSVESSEYKHVVLSLIFLKFVSDKFEERKATLIAEGKQAYTDMVEFYTMQNVFYLPETSRWSYIQQHAKQDDIAIKIDSALAQVEKSNASLKEPCPTTTFHGWG